MFCLNVFMIEFVSSVSLIFYLRSAADEYVWYIPVRCACVRLNDTNDSIIIIIMFVVAVGTAGFS